MITGIILAAGYARRMGQQKLLLKVGGIPIIERVIRAAQSSCIKEIIVVYHQEEIREIAEKYGIKTAYNPHPEKGQSTSLKLGIEKASLQSQGWIFFVGDQPFLTSQVINALIDKFRKGSSPIVVPLYKGRKGNPVIFSTKFTEQLLQIQGDKGGRKIIEENKKEIDFLCFDDEIIGMDIDTWETYEMYKDWR